jgi:AMMECR1 domain-containing protein
MAIKLGLDGKLWIGVPPSGSGSTTYNLVENARSVSLSLESAEADVTTRGNAGWRANVPTLKDATVEFEMIYDSGDARFGEIQSAFLDNEDLDVKVLDGGEAHTDGEGLVARCRVTTFSINQALEEAITVSVTLKPTYAPGNEPTWQTDTA